MSALASLHIVTRVGTGFGNLVIPTTLLYQHETPDGTNNYEGVYVEAAQVLRGVYLDLRTPLFRVGEILTIGTDGRDQFGRKPSKWDVDLEEVHSLPKAAARAQEAFEDQHA